MGSKEGEKMKKQAVAVIKQKKVAVIQGNSPADLIRMAVAGNADLDKLEKLLSIQRGWEADEARKAYNLAMADFKANPPRIDKDKEVSFETSKGTTKYNHATLGNVTEKISAELSKHGLSASWLTKQETDKICVTCRINHSQGHSEETTICAPADNSGSKNTIQQIGSTITYLERYTILALTGLATYDQDDDGVAAGQSGKKPVVTKPESNKPVVSKPAVKPENLTGKDGGNPTITKGLPEVVKSGFAKAEKALGKEKFYEIIGQQGYEKIEQITSEGVARQILRDMETAYQTMQKNGGK
jgi:hypothetical protein